MTRISQSQMQEFVDRINAQLPVHALWDGYKIRIFKRKNLVISGSQDWIYHHNIDLIFKKVIFFNLPAQWHDAAVAGDHLFRLTDQNEFKTHHPLFDPEDRHIFAIDLYSNFLEAREKHTFFIVAANVFFERLDDPLGDGIVEYQDPLPLAPYLSKYNRVIKD